MKYNDIFSTRASGRIPDYITPEQLSDLIRSELDPLERILGYEPSGYSLGADTRGSTTPVATATPTRTTAPVQTTPVYFQPSTGVAPTTTKPAPIPTTTTREQTTEVITTGTTERKETGERIVVDEESVIGGKEYPSDQYIPKDVPAYTPPLPGEESPLPEESVSLPPALETPPVVAEKKPFPWLWLAIGGLGLWYFMSRK